MTGGTRGAPLSWLAPERLQHPKPLAVPVEPPVSHEFADAKSTHLSSQAVEGGLLGA
jgi:hypothetical protein